MARHASIAEQLAPLYRYATTPDHDVEVIQTNWTTVAANDNNPEDVVDMHEERRVAMRPTVQEIMRSIAGGDVERGAAYTRKDGKRIDGPIIRIGRLHFSDGNNTERCIMAGIDGKPITGDIRMPLGSMLGAKEVQERTLGGSGVSKGENNRYFSSVFKVAHKAFVPSGKTRRGRSYSRDEASAMMAEAVANTKHIPPVMKCPDGLAMGTARVADNFIGMKMTPKGNGGSLGWQDLSDKIAAREEWKAALSVLSEEHKETLDAALTAKNMKQVGMSVGYKGKHAERRGKAALLAANDKLAAAIAAYVA